MRKMPLEIADGACAIEITSSDASRSDLATVSEFMQWSRDMIDKCKVDAYDVKGGIAGNLGQ